MFDKKLFNIELYYSPHKTAKGDKVYLTGDEFIHASKVMRHKTDDEIYITDGNGLIIKGKIIRAGKDEFVVRTEEKFVYENELSNITFCIPKLKNPDRFKFALEKCVELGVTNFIVFTAGRSIAKGGNIKRWEKILLSAMKQSLRAFLPRLEVYETLKEITELPGRKIIFDQSADKKFSVDSVGDETCCFIFGPEGGLTVEELSLFEPGSFYFLSDYRLRSETAIVKAASLL